MKSPASSSACRVARSSFVQNFAVRAKSARKAQTAPTSFVAVIVSLLAMNSRALRSASPAGRRRGQLREGVRTVARDPLLGFPILTMALVGALALEWEVTLPVLARDVLDGGPQTYGTMTGALGLGAIVGGLARAARGSTGLGAVNSAVATLGVALTAVTLAPTAAVAVGALVLVGAAMVSFYSTAIATIQLAASAQVRGRVMALWFVAFQGSTAVGGPLIGWIMVHTGARVGIAVGAGTCLAVSAGGTLAMARTRTRTTVT